MSSVTDKLYIRIQDSDALMAIKDGCMYRVRTSDLISLINGTPTTEPNAEQFLYLGSVASTPSTEAEIKSSTTETPLYYNTVSFRTGTVNKKFIIAIPLDRTIDSIINSGTSEDLTNNFSLIIPSINIIDQNEKSVAYNVYEMSNAVPFSNNYLINITLS